MPAYVTSPFKAVPELLVAGRPSYVFGSYNDRTSPTVGSVISDSSVTTTATVVFQILSGLPPIVGAKITVRGTANSAGVFNSPTTGTILTVSTDLTTGVCTVTYAISSTTQASTADAGEVMVPQTEIGEALAVGATSSVPVAAPSNNPNINQAKLISANVSFPSAPSTGIVTLQGANFDIDAEYQDLVTVYNSSTNTTGTAEVESNYRFYRLRVTGASGGSSPTIVGKIEC